MPGKPLRLLFFLVFLVPSSGYTDKPDKPLSKLERVKQAGEIKIVTRFDSSSYYEGPEGYAGLEHDLGELFAKRLGVKASFIVPNSFRQVTEMVENHQADFAAAGLMVNESRKHALRYAPAYRRITEQVVYRSDGRKPHGVTDLSQGIFEVVAGVSHVDTLRHLRQSNPGLHWKLNHEYDAEGLLHLVNEGLLDYTIVHSDQMLRTRSFYPHVRVAFNVGKPRDLAWAFPKEGDSSLYEEAVSFFNEIRQSKELDRLIDRYYGHGISYDAALDRSLRLDFRKRLPRYRASFQRAAREHGLDWRLLAALAYQESHWDRRAVSEKGVRGLMMLTGITAKELHVDRLDPAQSIRGGASYLKYTLDAIPEQIDGPDRTWMALAAYNVGYGHIQDARSLVKERGGNPDRWIDVKEALPLLGKRSWYRRTRHGRARGSGAVHYVNSIRRYYELLVWLTEEDEMRRVAMSPTRARADGA